MISLLTPARILLLVALTGALVAGAFAMQQQPTAPAQSKQAAYGSYCYYKFQVGRLANGVRVVRYVRVCVR